MVIHDPVLVHAAGLHDLPDHGQIAGPAVLRDLRAQPVQDLRFPVCPVDRRFPDSQFGLRDLGGTIQALHQQLPDPGINPVNLFSYILQCHPGPSLFAGRPRPFV